MCLKVPSKGMSCRLDCLINDNVLVEIKSCNYTDLQDIIKQGKPRVKDFYQAALYKYLLENYLDEIKQQKPSRGGTIPLLDNYKIEWFQIVYVCHELVSGDTSSLSEAVKFAKNLRKLNNSRRNPFWFIQTMNIDLSTINMPVYENIIKEKIDDIRYHLDNNIVPPMDSKFVDKSACFFCLHGDICRQQG